MPRLPIKYRQLTPIPVSGSKIKNVFNVFMAFRPPNCGRILGQLHRFVKFQKRDVAAIELILPAVGAQRDNSSENLAIVSTEVIFTAK
jgi:hypothetical protein